jgi:hypothetical protein
MYNLSIKKHGKNKHKFHVVTKTQITFIPNGWKAQLADIISSPQRNDLSRLASKLSLSDSPKPKSKTPEPKLLNFKIGQNVGSDAAPIGDDNVGHRLLLKLGWKPGESLGDGTGIVNPIAAVIRKEKAGIGTI